MPLTIASNAMTDAGDHFAPTPTANLGGAPFSLKYFDGIVNGKNKYTQYNAYDFLSFWYYIQYNNVTQKWEIWFYDGETDVLQAESVTLNATEPWLATWTSPTTVSVNPTRNVDCILQASMSSSSYKGYRNIIFGANAQTVTTGDGNIIINPNFVGCSTGRQNVIIGIGSGTNISSGTSNVAIGQGAYSSGNFSNSSCLGGGSSVTAGNQVQLGNSATTTYAYGAVQNRSDERDKTEIRDTELGLDFVKSLRPVDFKWDMREDYRAEKPVEPSESATQEEKDAYAISLAQWEESVKLSNITHDGSKKRTRFHHGLIAQEVKAVLDAKGIDFGGFQDHKINGGDDVLSIGYAELIAPMIKAIQELSAEVASLKAQMNP